jgi:hypothetical protein
LFVLYAEQLRRMGREILRILRRESAACKDGGFGGHCTRQGPKLEI